MGDSGYMDAAAVPVPDAGDDKLREQIAEKLHEVGCEQTQCTNPRWIDRYQTDALLPLIREHVTKAAPERWWICTDALKDGGKKIHGPFGSRDLALQVRVYVEQVNHPTTYWVDREEADRG